MGHRHPQVVKARHAAWERLYRTANMSYPQIAGIFGCTHSTVFAAVRNVTRDRRNRRGDPTCPNAVGR